MILALWRAKSTPLGSFAASASNGKGKSNAPIEIDTEDEDEEDEDDDIQVVEPEAAGWLYVGSHNFTPSAW
jgi:tyrosyl-DNA phosphodiesterase 1